ncbi:vitamin B12 dependent methionine synthase [Desulfosporosinus orientis DSM 765]|uniref:Vitamin B12 dependent methionine synthase n=1 Tax=Desulfosporosinus orientis (strain ATCC 19365 / DSM 765 / NCIMB 8382 / VKM B-1628 / Singapore I) TaxID=768706 RepID=G7WFG2_DESOD|nr:vitamin B12 dependent-methionine synthase activation domain-containing protein [Desulfosporosinus orientis]AET68405.1 vitamin B12 dependent methionine synthase [Desulfosporosinus orientis DSM 765]
MDAVVLNNIPCQIDLEILCKKLRLKEDSSFYEEVAKLVAEAQQIARPKGIYKSTLIEEKGDNFVTIEGIKFTSKILRKNIGENYMVFPFVATCGVEIEEWSKQFDDYFTVYCVDTIKEMVLQNARQALMSQIDKIFNLEHASNMNPGSLPDWPITEQRPLFKLLGNVEELIGVHLTESCLLLPVKTVSGIRFFKESSFESCQLCLKLECPNRKAPFNEEMYKQYHG